MIIDSLIIGSLIIDSLVLDYSVLDSFVLDSLVYDWDRGQLWKKGFFHKFHEFVSQSDTICFVGDDQKSVTIY